MRLLKPLTTLVLMGVLVIMNVILFAGSRIVTDLEWPKWIATALEALADLGTIAIGILGVILLVGLAMKGWKWANSLEKEEVKAEPETVADHAQRTVGEINSILEQIEQEKGQADQHLYEANKRVEALVEFTKSMAQQVSTMTQEATALKDLLAAIGTGDRAKIGAAAGLVGDPSISTLALVNFPDNPEYTVELVTLVGHQMGILTQWVLKYNRITNNVIGEIRQAKGRQQALLAKRELVALAKPMVQLSQHLTDAESNLRLFNTSNVRQELESFPVVSVPLLKD